MGKALKFLADLGIDDFGNIRTSKKKSKGPPVLASLHVSNLQDSQLEGLNDGQREMVIGINEYLTVNSEGKDFYMVQGGGGVGKSYSIGRALQFIPPTHILAAAPSHFAKLVLQDFLGPEYEVTTVASLLGKIISYDNDGNEILVDNPRIVVRPVDKVNIIIIDEASMIADDTFEELLEACKGKKLIALGDYAQLPPVGQDHDSRFFDTISAELTQPMRFTGHIYNLTKHFRVEIDKIRRGESATASVINRETDRESRLEEDGSGYVFIQSNRSLIKLAVSLFKQNRGSSYVRIITYRNKTIDTLNTLIREQLFGKSDKKFQIGEIIINKKGYSINADTNRAKPIIRNGEIFKIEHIEAFEGPYKVPSLKLILDKDFEDDIIVVAKEGDEIYKRILKRLNKLAESKSIPWSKVRAFKNAFAYFDYAYSVSVHKSQGSTIENVFIIEDDILDVRPTTVKEKLQSLYVGVSRAAYRVYIFNKKFKAYNSDDVKKKLKATMK